MYNPPNNWEKEVVRQYKDLRKRLESHIHSRLILIDDGTEWDISKGKQVISDTIPEATWIVNQKNKSKGHALREGVRRSQGDIIMYTDHDFPYTYGTMQSMVEKIIEEDLDVVIGIRDESYYDHISGPRKWISSYLKSLNNKFLRLPTSDTQCGLKVFRSNVKELFLATTTNRYLIDVEFLLKLDRNSIKLGLYTVKLRENVKLSKIANLRLLSELWTYIKLIRTH